MSKICIVGTGAWGMGIGYLLSCNKENKEIWYFSSSKAESSDDKIINSYKDLKDFDYIFIAIPTKVIKDFYTNAFNFLPCNIVSCSKGIVMDDQYLVSSLFNHNYNFAVLSGPNFADEVINHAKTITTVASSNDEYCQDIVDLIKSDILLCQKLPDVQAVEVLGILKNIIAIGFGAMSFYNEFENTRSLFLTEILHEVKLILSYFTKNPHDVLLSSAGIGDIILTCYNGKSRNFTFGYQLMQEIENNIKLNQDITVEGVRSKNFIATIISLYPDLSDKIPYFIKIVSLIDQNKKFSI